LFFVFFCSESFELQREGTKGERGGPESKPEGQNPKWVTKGHKNILMGIAIFSQDLELYLGCPQNN
jgi:hypothetical protein